MKSRTRRRTVVYAVGLTAASVALILNAALLLGSRAPVVIVLEHPVSLGIPGISKQYEAVLVNRTLWPLRVTACDWVDVELERGRLVPRALERWNPLESRWDFVSGVSHEFCNSYPVETIERRLRRRWLWPLQEISSGASAIAALDSMQLGDVVRYSVYLDWPENGLSGVVSRAFIIDECRQYSYLPLGWREVRGRTLFENTYADGLEIATEGLAGCFRSPMVETELLMGNATARAIELDGAELRVDSNQFRGEVIDVDSSRRQLLLMPGASGRWVLRWVLEDDADLVLGSTPTIILSVQIDGKPLAVSIDYGRVS